MATSYMTMDLAYHEVNPMKEIKSATCVTLNWTMVLSNCEGHSTSSFR